MNREMHSSKLRQLGQCIHPVGDRLWVKLPLHYLYSKGEKVPVVDGRASEDREAGGIFAK